MNGIRFFNEDTTFLLKHKSVLRTWIKRVIVQEKLQLESLNYIFCSDQYLWKMNKEYLEHDTYTDIITFDNSSGEKMVEADVFISVDRVKENAQIQNITFLQELYRVMVHGILHLMGFNDKTPNQKRVMSEKEDACISLLKL